jgi:hypothetical protein
MIGAAGPMFSDCGFQIAPLRESSNLQIMTA